MNTKKKLNGKIAMIDKDKGFGSVIVENIFYSIQKKHTDKNVWEALEKGVHIEFDEFISTKNRCATNIQLYDEKVIEAKESTIKDITSTISHLDKTKGFGSASYNGKLYSIQKTHTDEAVWNQLEKDVPIIFDEFISTNNKYYAANIRLVSQPEEITQLENEKLISIDELVSSHGRFYDNWLQKMIQTTSENIPQLNETTSSEDFEDFTFTLLKLLGINDIYQFPRYNQAGKPDGIFKIGSLIVIYDCTLQKNFETNKDWQMENFAKKLTESKLKIDVRKEIDGETLQTRHTFDLTNLDKQLWVITRGKTREIETLERITIKEVGIDSLLNLLRHRLTKNYFDETRLVKELIDIH